MRKSHQAEYEKRWKRGTQVRCHHVRCNHRKKPGKRACGARRTLTRPLHEYYRVPKCRKCGHKEWRFDRYRPVVELKVKPCNCGNYGFPHRRGSGLCEHNPNLTEDSYEEMLAAWRARRYR